MKMEIALGIVLGYVLLALFKNPIDAILKWLWQIEPAFNSQSKDKDAGQQRTRAGVSGNLEETEDWTDLWASVPESAKEKARRTVEDLELLRRVMQESQGDLVNSLWGTLWIAAPEETRETIRSRWREKGVSVRS